MDVVFVTREDLFPPVHGAAAKILRTAEALAGHGAGVCIVTRDRDRYLRFEGETWRRIPYPPRVRAAQEWPPLPRMARLAERLCQIVGYPPEEHFLYTPMFDPSWWLRAVAVGRREGADVFQAEFPGFGVPAGIAARVLGARAVVVEHNVEYDRLAQTAFPAPGALRRMRAVEHRVLRAMDEVVTVSAEDREILVRGGVPRESLTVIPHGVDLAPYQAALADREAIRARIRDRYGLAEGAPLLFFHGVLHYEPNARAVRFMVEQMLPALLPRWPSLRLVMAGMNPPTYYAHPNVVFPGVVADLAHHVVAADLAVCPLDAGGGTRMKLLEYFAGGRAVVSTAKGAEGLRCRSGRELRIAPMDRGFAAACTELLADPAERARLGAGARDFARRYDWSAVGQVYLDLYRGRGRGTDANVRLAGDGARESHPLTLLLMLNRTCNLDCTFCGIPAGRSRMEVEGEALPLLDEARAIGTEVLVITGGEPLLHSEVFTLVRGARKRGLAVNITTNGTRVADRWEALVASGVNSVSISVDGLRRTHDGLRGRPGTWDRAVGAARRLCRETDVGVSLYFVLTRHNLEELVAVHDLACQMGAGFDFWPVNHASEHGLLPEQEPRYREILRELAARDPEVARRRPYLACAPAYHAGALGRVRCRGLVDQYGVTPEGDLIPCCVWGRRELVVGNVFQTPLSTLWRAPATERLRRRIRERGCEAGCFNHSLWSFQETTGQPFRVEASTAANQSRSPDTVVPPQAE